VGGEKATGSPVLVYLQYRHQVQPQENEVHEIVFGHRFSIQMGMDAAQAAKATAVTTSRRKLRDEY
jgi:hypothetical protein